MRRVCKGILKVLGWKLNGEIPPIDKFVICLAPHTSNLDFIIGKLFYSSLGLKVSFLIKREWLRPPFGTFMRRRGAIGIDRNRRSNMTVTLAELFRQKTHLHLAITPEGTRKRNPDWKMGFYYIAKNAGVPILVVGLDYKKREVVILDLFYPTDNEEADIHTIKSKYIGVTALHPKKFSLGDGF